MTVRNGQLALSSQGGYVNPRVTVALRSIDPAWVGWPTSQADIAGSFQSQTARGTPGQPSYTVAGVLARSYMDDYYYRVHLRPGNLDLGTLSTAQQRQVEVWNAWPAKSLMLNSTELENGSGIAVTAPGALPFTFAPNQSSLWNLGVGLDGPAHVDATLTWLFADATADVSLQITGNRLTAWTVLPDWSDGITESLAWLTDVQTALDGSQDRTPLRGSPRRQWEFPVIAEGQDRTVMEALLYDASARNYALPVWQDWQVLDAQAAAGAQQIACDTDGRDFAVGDQVLLWQASTVYELAEVESVASGLVGLKFPLVNTWAAGTRLYPCRQAALTDWPQLDRITDMLAKAQLRFETREECTWPAVAPATTYLGYPVLGDSLEWSDDPSAQYARVVTITDNDTGLPVVDDFSGLAWPTQSHAWLLANRGEQTAHRNLLYWLQGRAQALWVPSWQSDLTLTALLAGTATSMTVQLAYIARLNRLQPGRRHIRIELHDGSVFYRRVTGASESQSSESLALDSALGVDVAAADVRRISWMMLATLAADEVQIAHPTDSDGVARCVVRFAGVPKEEP